MQKDILTPKIKIYDHHLPAMENGEYVLEVFDDINHGKIKSKNSTVFTRTFRINGERYSLNQQDIRSVFPVNRSTGDFARDLPHIIIDRNTQPWEWRSNAADENLPWMVLLMFDESEVPDKKIITVKELKNSDSALVNYASLSGESDLEDEQQLTIIDVPKSVMANLMPSSKSLRLMAHTRQGLDANDKVVGEEHAVIFANRLPQQGGRSTMHLVSIEGRYDDDGFMFSDNELPYRLVSLFSWDFNAIEHFKITADTLEIIKVPAQDDFEKLSALLNREFAGTKESFITQVAVSIGRDSIPDTYHDLLIDHSKFDKTFDGLLTNLDQRNLILRLPDGVANQAGREFLAAGLVPMEHRFRNGEESVSWYRGPFVPLPIQNKTMVRKLKPETSDELTQFNETVGMFDVTYSSAWELGRLMALANKEFSVNLFRWKRLIVQRSHQLKQMEGIEHLASFPHSDNHESADQIWMEHLQPWLTQLITFDHIPASYLVPDQNMLERESIRFFHVDPNWQTSAMLGAFSVGGSWEAVDQLAQNSFNTFLDELNTTTMGFLLRSDVVAGWPGIIIEGTSTDGVDVIIPSKHHLSSNVLLCLFDQEISKVIFHQKPEVIHFGLLKSNSDFSKSIRDNDGNKVDTYKLKTMDWKSKSDRVLDMATLAKNMGEDQQPARFAMNMIEGIPRVEIKIN